MRESMAALSQEMTAMAQAESAAKEQCRAAQQEAEGHLAVLEAKQQQDGVLKDEIARLSAGEVERLQDETNINKSYADAVRADIAQAEEEAERLSETVKEKEAEITTLQTQLQEAGASSELVQQMQAIDALTQEMAAVAEAEAAANEQCRVAQEEAEGHLAVLEAKQQQDDVLKGGRPAPCGAGAAGRRVQGRDREAERRAQGGRV
uniref:Uncharacterized protein n=1 Tax=Eutreptiella gymnastica TaxID=73025 RepID=A0A7S4LAL8_9EUGL